MEHSESKFPERTEHRILRITQYRKLVTKSKRHRNSVFSFKIEHTMEPLFLFLDIKQNLVQSHNKE